MECRTTKVGHNSRPNSPDLSREKVVAIGNEAWHLPKTTPLGSVTLGGKLSHRSAIVLCYSKLCHSTIIPRHAGDMRETAGLHTVF